MTNAANIWIDQLCGQLWSSLPLQKQCRATIFNSFLLCRELRHATLPSIEAVSLREIPEPKTKSEVKAMRASTNVEIYKLQTKSNILKINDTHLGK